MKKKIILFSVLLIGIIVLSVALISPQKEAKKEVTKTEITEPADSIPAPETKQKDTLTWVAVGDMMLGTNYPTSPNYLPPGDDCAPLLEEVIEYLRDADLTFGNLEGVLSDKPEYAKSCNDPKWCYRFSMPEKYINCFIDAGFDVVSIANNHIYDAGSWGSKNTVKVLKEAGMNFAGLTTIPKDTFSIDGIKYGFAAYAPNSGTCQITDYAAMEKTVKSLDETCDVVLVSFHGGAEGSKYEHVTRNYEHFLGQNRGNVNKFAHKAIDAGADLVIGHGPHVTRSLELYKDRLIAYSLGNFCTYRRFNIRGVSGIAPILKVWTDREGKFIKANITATYQDKLKGTKLDSEKKVIKRLQELMAADFPETPLRITDEGEVLRKTQ
jgi:poly-gamma-glutamate capsule biosynthesis protein CapA/YwtB (metallophosphatase superfamily)